MTVPAGKMALRPVRLTECRTRPDQGGPLFTDCPRPRKPSGDCRNAGRNLESPDSFEDGGLAAQLRMLILLVVELSRVD
jgi:hypothetical protein